jgi:hypothetical protein
MRLFTCSLTVRSSQPDKQRDAPAVHPPPA